MKSAARMIVCHLQRACCVVLYTASPQSKVFELIVFSFKILLIILFADAVWMADVMEERVHGCVVKFLAKAVNESSYSPQGSHRALLFALRQSRGLKAVTR